MSTRAFLLFAVCALTAGTATAYPPAPYHRIYGSVKDEQGQPLRAEEGVVILRGTGDVELVRGFTDPSIGPGINYSVNIQMDSGTTALLYEVTALRPLLPFTIRVVINGVTYVPIQAVSAFNIGNPAGQTRIDLTFGLDSDSDGLPDSWEQELIDGYYDATGILLTRGDIRPGDDFDGDGMTNFDEYIAGTYALDGGDRLRLDVIEVTPAYARLRFVAITGRTYRLTSSPNLLLPFVEQPFALAPAAAPVVQYLAPGVEYRDVYVSPAAAKYFFKLHVQ
jgi:hypothetical protein